MCKDCGLSQTEVRWIARNSQNFSVFVFFFWTVKWLRLLVIPLILNWQEFWEFWDNKLAQTVQVKISHLAVKAPNQKILIKKEQDKNDAD